MTGHTLEPGHWPTDPQTLDWMEQKARRYLGSDYAYLAPDVVSSVCEDWRFKETPGQEQSRIETRLRSKSYDLRRSEQRRKQREINYSNGPTGSRAYSESSSTFHQDLQDALDQEGIDETTREYIDLVLKGYSISEIERLTGATRYKIMKSLKPVGRILKKYF